MATSKAKDCKFVLKMAFFSNVLSWLLLFSSISSGEAYVSHNPKPSKGNITIKWDLVQWTPDGYVAVVNIYNFQNHQTIQAPGWTLGWTWSMNEVIWSMFGAKTKGKGDCSKFVGNIPNSCERDPSVVDLPRHTPYNMQVGNCCKDGVLKSWDEDRGSALSAFQITVGVAGTTNRTVHLPKSFTFKAPGLGYICGQAVIVAPTKFFTADRKRVTQALMTWRLACYNYQQ